jgi:hypothetical protein
MQSKNSNCQEDLLTLGRQAVSGSVLPFRAIRAAQRSDSLLSEQTNILAHLLGDEVNLG